MRCCRVDKQSLGVGVGGAAIVGVAFGMGRYAYGLTLPDVRSAFGLSEPLLGLIASGTFVGFLLGLLSVPRLSSRRGPRAPTTVGAACGVVGALTVALAPTPTLLALGAMLSGSAAGWVWAPYSDIVTQVVPPSRQSALLAAITTGISVGLIALGVMRLLTMDVSWRLTWMAIGICAAVAALVNLRAVPKLPPRRDVPGRRGWPWRRSMIAPLTFSVLRFTAITIYFTYSGQAVRGGDAAAWVSPALFALIGVGGLTGLSTGRLTTALGSAAVGVASVCVVGASVLLLALGRGRWRCSCAQRSCSVRGS